MLHSRLAISPAMCKMIVPNRFLQRGQPGTVTPFPPCTPGVGLPSMKVEK
jgi:hypothetical protein